MAGLRDPFIPPSYSVRSKSVNQLFGGGRPVLSGLDFSVVKKRGQGSRSWIRIDVDGQSEVLELDKASLMRRCNLPARDLRLLDPLFVYPTTILGREKAIIVNLEQIRCIITADEVLLMNSLDSCVRQYELELLRRLDMNKNLSADDLPFEFRALEVALELACALLDAQVTELEIEIYPVLDELASSISTLNLERVRRMKSHILALTRRVQKVRDEIEHLMDDDGDMAEMYLTEKKERNKAYASSELYISNFAGFPRASMSAPVSPLSHSGSGKIEKALSSAMSRSRIDGEHVEELEMLLEAYFVVIDGTLNKLLSLKEYIDDTEIFINIKLDNIRNQLIQFELLLTTGTFVVTIFAAVAGVFGMNIVISFFHYAPAFVWVMIITAIFGGLIFISFLWYYKHKKLIP
ncbi:hypothetical protein AMTRI_Chr10g1500 [Amborella trichopoda]